MKKILLTAILLIGTLTGFGQKFHFSDTTGLDSYMRNTIARLKPNLPSYVIEQRGSIIYATPSYGLTAFEDNNLTPVLQNCIDALISGGLIQIKRGLYDNMDSISINNDGITIQGEGMYLTKLKLKDGFDVDRDAASFINIKDGDYTIIRDLELDGNLVNQTKLDNNNFADGYHIFCTGIYANSGDEGGTHYPDYLLIENCYVHDFSGNGITICNSTGTVIRGVRAEDSGSNQITLAGDCINGVIENCLARGGGDVALSLGASSSGNYNCIIRNNRVLDVNGSYGSNGARYGIEVGGIKGQILSNYITGANTVRGIYGMPSARQSIIKGNIIDSLQCSTGSTGIGMTYDSMAVIMDNIITNVKTDGIVLVGCRKTKIMNNYISMPAASSSAIAFTNYTSTYTTDSYIGNNYIWSLGSLALNFISSANNNNTIANNIIYGAGKDYDFHASTTGTIWMNNYGVKTASLMPDAINQSIPVTATSGGLTPGILVPGSQNVTVTSASADYIVCLPAAGATSIGTKITGVVGANGFKLRVAAAQAATVYLNGVTTSVEAAIPANSSFEAIQVDPTHWTLKAWTALGAEITAIVPDAI